jgi:hypothetical protein
VGRVRKEEDLKAFENRELSRVFQSQRKEAIWGQRKLHNEELHNVFLQLQLFRSSN